MNLRAWPILFLAVAGPFCLSQRTSQITQPLNPEPFGSEFRVEPTKPITIAGLETILADNKNTSDKKLAAMLSGYSLSERATSSRMSRWVATSPGSRTRQALIALADGSAFLPLPAEDIPASPAPSIEEQRRMMNALGNYLKDTLPALPNFVANRHTIYFEDGPTRQLPLFSRVNPVDPTKNLPVHLVGTSDLQVSYVDGHEVIRKKEGSTGFDPYSTRLSTNGEFGAILYGITLDASKSKLVWRGWEKGDNGLVAVFRFEAAPENSHYTLTSPSASKPKTQSVAYRGEITINPADGSIVRITLVAQPSLDIAMAEADVAVEYGPIEIGQHLYTCPVHGVALSKMPVRHSQTVKPDQPTLLQTQINDVVFEQFHIFRGDSRILQEADSQP